MRQARYLVTMLLLALAGTGAWVWQTKVKLADAEKAIAGAAAESVALVKAKDEERSQAIGALRESQQRDLDDLRQKHESEVSDLRNKERQRVAEAFQQFGDILEGNKKTVDSLTVLEQKVKAGQALSANEAQKLATITTGLGYLQKQYEKPLQEFTELEAYLSSKAELHLESPSMRNAFWKRIFSRNFREQEREYYRNEGERRGFQEASERFNAAYASAQKQMKSVNLNMDKALADLQAVVDDKATGQENLDEFFQQARKALTTHQKLLEFQPEEIQPQSPEPRS